MCKCEAKNGVSGTNLALTYYKAHNLITKVSLEKKNGEWSPLCDNVKYNDKVKRMNW